MEKKDWRTPRVVKYILKKTGEQAYLRGRAGKPMIITNIFNNK
jgi:hypothetical protein